MRAKGARPSHASKLARTLSAAVHPVISVALAGILAGAAAPNTAKHPVNWLPEPAEDQGQSSACTAHAFSQGMGGTCGARGVNLGFSGPISPRHGYSCSGAIERAAATPLGLPPALQDNGRELADVIAAALTCGVKAMAVTTTPDGRFSDVWTDADVAGLPSPPPANVNDEPGVQDLGASVHDCLSGAHTVDLQASNALDQCAAALDSGYALFVGFSCGSSFENLTATDIAGPTPPNDPEQGGHAVAIVSYRINAAGRREFRVQNSWGPSWADRGGVWVNEAWVLALWECWILSEELVAKLAA